MVGKKLSSIRHACRAEIHVSVHGSDLFALDLKDTRQGLQQQQLMAAHDLHAFIFVLMRVSLSSYACMILH